MGRFTKYISPQYDFAFKRLFGDQKNADITISFLNAVLHKKDGEKIVSLTFLDPHNKKDSSYDKESIVDVRCKDEQGKIYIVEMQVTSERDYEQRSQYYASCDVAKQFEHKVGYHKLVPVYFVGILNFNLFRDDKKFYRRLELVDTTDNIYTALNHKDFAPLTQFYFIELLKFTKEMKQIKDILDKWAFILRHATEQEEVPEEFKKDKALCKAFDVLEFSNLKPEERKQYIKTRENERAYESIMRQREEEGEAKGMAKGIAKGMAQGEALGEARGRKEEAVTIALNLINLGLSDEQISSATKLSLQEIQHLRLKK